MNYKPIEHWENICLDTGMIIGRLAAERTTTKDPELLWSKKLLDFLVTSKTKAGRDRTFWISSITLSELLNREPSHTVKASKIYNALSAKNLNFHPFDNDVAFHMVNNYYSVLNKNTQHSIIKQLRWNIPYDIGREHITRDLMIMATGDFKNCDVLLSYDKKTLYKLSKEINVFCALAYKAFFHTNGSGDIVFSYDRTIPDKELGYI